LTKEALDTGCFGTPWWIITNSEGKTENFFGADRWEHVCDFMGEEFLGYFPQKKLESRL
jgi:2-hydroxychromene-2-carboxylate isomerase